MFRDKIQPYDRKKKKTVQLMYFDSDSDNSIQVVGLFQFISVYTATIVRIYDTNMCRHLLNSIFI